MVFSYILLLAVICSALASNPVVKSPYGTFLGSTLTAWNGQNYNAFRGIPYAKPPLKDLRFRPPAPADPIDGLYDATNFRPYCIQFNIIPHQFNLGQEDCLYLNVFTPRFADRDDGNLKKVLVFFHGGGNTNGFPDVFLPGTLVTEHDVIVVTVAYRLGYLGILSTMTPYCEGNFFLKDQLQSLRWVKENILEFGGDPAGVTISGESAGAMDVSLLTLVPSSRDLFARALSQSGVTGTKNTILISNPRPDTIKISRKLGCLQKDQPDPINDSEFDDLVDCLRQLPASSFSNNGTSEEIPHRQAVLYGDLFPRSIEELFSDESYLNSIKFFDRDYLIGLDENEGDLLHLINDQIFSTLPKEVKEIMTPQVLFQNSIKMFMAPVYGPVSQEVIDRIVDYYENNPEINPLADFGADVLFHVSTIQYVTAAAAGRSPDNSRVFLFRFVHNPEWLLPPYQGMLHGLDVLYLFDLDIETGIKFLPLKVDTTKWNEKDDQLRKKYISLVADFVKTGNPGKSLAELLPGWPGFDKEQQQYLQFGLKSEVKHHFLPERMKLWSEQIPQWIKDFPAAKQHEEL